MNSWETIGQMSTQCGSMNSSTTAWPRKLASDIDRKSTRLIQSPCNLVCRLLLEKTMGICCTLFCDSGECFYGLAICFRNRLNFLYGKNTIILSSICQASFLKDTATTEIYPLSLHDALPIYIADSKNNRIQMLTFGPNPSATTPLIADKGIVNAASFTAPVARGGWATIYGSNFPTGAARIWNSSD